MHRFTIAAIAATGGFLLAASYVLESPAMAGNAEILEQECHKQLRLGDSACACIGDQAEKQLNENQRALVVALVTKNQAASGAVQAKMTVEELTEAGKFMQEAPKLCASE